MERQARDVADRRRMRIAPERLDQHRIAVVRAAERAIVGSTAFDIRAPAAEDALPAIITAFDDALGAVLKRLVAWTLETGEVNKPII